MQDILTLGGFPTLRSCHVALKQNLEDSAVNERDPFVGGLGGDRESG